MADEKIYINVEEGLGRVLNNSKLYVRLLGKFKADPNLADLCDCLAAGDLEKARVCAHTLKGLAANLSLTELFERTRDLESGIKEGSVPDGAADALRAVYGETIKKADEVIAQYGS
jgi:HPt (histidine-containing phosphotransfer) domain-containing protein